MELVYFIVGEKIRFLYDFLVYIEFCLFVFIDVEKGI